jgi:hypothetical protein
MKRKDELKGGGRERTRKRREVRRTLLLGVGAHWSLGIVLDATVGFSDFPYLETELNQNNKK